MLKKQLRVVQLIVIKKAIEVLKHTKTPKVEKSLEFSTRDNNIEFLDKAR